MSIHDYEAAAIETQHYRMIGQARIREREKGAYMWGKRALDLTCTIAGLILASPVFIAIAILLKVENPRGYIFFAQERVGKNGKVFRMYKFRSMVPDAELLLTNLLDRNEVEGAMFKMKDDPRVTKVGRWIRKTSLDELPQFWNVLKGEMSLVGPRPSLPRELSGYTVYDMQRLLVTPGCTGLWQINGRSSIGFKEMVELDLQYIENRKLSLDLMIMLKTVKVLFGSNEAF